MFAKAACQLYQYEDVPTGHFTEAKSNYAKEKLQSSNSFLEVSRTRRILVDLLSTLMHKTSQTMSGLEASERMKGLRLSKAP